MRGQAIAIHFAGAALFAGAAAWALQQQAGYVVSSWLCHYDAGPIWLVTAMALAILLAGSWLSWQVLRLAGNSDSSDLWRPRRFLSLVGLMMAMLFLFPILLQAVAAAYLPGCVG
jgi:hypothetical protein